MTRCQDRRQMMLLYLTDALDDSEREELADHLQSGCPRCAGYLAEAHATLGRLPLVLHPTAPPPSVKSRLMARVRADPDGTDSSSEPVSRRLPATGHRKPAVGDARPEPNAGGRTPSAHPRNSSWLQWFVAPAAAAALAVLATLAIVSNSGSNIDELRAKIALLQSQLHDTGNMDDRRLVGATIDDQANRGAAAPPGPSEAFAGPHMALAMEKLFTNLSALFTPATIQFALLRGHDALADATVGLLLSPDLDQCILFASPDLDRASAGAQWELLFYAHETDTAVAVGSFEFDEFGLSVCHLMLPDDADPHMFERVTIRPTAAGAAGETSPMGQGGGHTLHPLVFEGTFTQ